jgi:hypothetical protein
MYGFDINYVEEQLDEALSDMRVHAIVAEAENDSTLQRKFWYIPTSGVCCVCGTIIDGEEECIQIPQTPLCYCSSECEAAKPYEDVIIEYRFGLEPKLVTKWAFKRFKSVSMIEKALGLNRNALGRLLERWLNTNLQSFYEINSTAKPAKRIVTGIQKIDDYFSKVIDVHGNPKIKPGKLIIEAKKLTPKKNDESSVTYVNEDGVSK